MKINCPDKTNSTMSRMPVRKENLDECMAIHKINSASSPDFPDDSGVLCKVPAKSPTASSSSINASDFHRYSRSALYLLRNDIRSKRRPECALRAELMSLGVWKLNSGQQNGNDAGSNTAMSCGNSNVSSAVSHIHTRGQRSPSRRTNIASTEHLSGTQYGQHAHANQRNYVDQRTVSSAHLMPAFAKRRLPSVVGAGLFSNSASSGSISTVRPETPNELVTDPDHSYRQRCKEQFSDRQRTEQSSSVNYLSPQRKNPGGYENDRSERTEAFNSGSVSPGASSAHSTTRHCLTMCGNERRIGSGRLLHCDVNWDYCADKDKMKNITDKDPSGIHHPHTHRTRFNERERNERSNFSERRPFERRSNDFEGPDKLENRNITAHYNAGCSRRFVSNDPENMSNRVPGAEQQNTRPRRYYNERSDEPEWFSGGPTSQNDTIELRGFDELDDQCGGNNKNSRRKISESSSSRATRSINLSNSVSKDPQLGKELHGNEAIGSCTGNTKNTPCYKKERSTKQSDEQETTMPSKNEKKRHVDQLNLNEEEKENAKYDNKKNYFQFGFSDFNFDAFFNVDPMNNSIMGTDPKQDSDLGMTGSSRFSRWFVNKSSQPEAINRNTFNVENDTKSDDLRDIKKTETEGLLYSSGPSESSNVKQSNTLMQFLQRSRLPPTLSEGVQPHGGITSVEELEASMRKMPTANESTSNEDKQKNSLSKDNPGSVVSLPQQTDPLTQTTVPTTPKDTEAFKKLLEQLGSANELDHHYSHTTHELQKENQERHTSLKTSQYVTENTFPPQMSQNEEYKIFIKQQELMHQQQRRLQHKKTIPAQLPQNESAFSALSSFIPTINEKPGIENLNMLQGVPCSREVELHTQNIQNTIMKKKLEEQEHLRKRQETQKPNSIPAKLSLEGEMSQKTLHRYQYQLKSSNGVPTQLSPQNSQILQKPSQQHHSIHSANTQPQQRHNNSPTPLAFTPTSVLRKMTAEKENTSSVPTTQYQQTANQMHTSNSMPQHQQSQIHVQNANKNLQSGLNQHQLIQPQSHQQPPVMNSQPPAIQQPRMILGGGVQQQQIQLGGKQSTPQQHTLQSQKHSSSIHTTPQSQRSRNSQQQLKWQVPSVLSQHQISISKPIGRPILKGPLQNQQQKQQQLITPMLFASKIEFQQIQQQQQKSFQHLHQQPFPISQQQQTQHTAHTNIMTHVQQQLFQNQQQQRAAALHRAQHIQMQHMHQQQQQHLNTPTGLIGSNQSHCATTGSTTTGNGTGIINYQRDGGLSPTSNQLAQWFSPELLAQASAGKLPLLNVNQALSLEEFERSIQHSSTSVHN